MTNAHGARQGSLAILNECGASDSISLQSGDLADLTSNPRPAAVEPREGVPTGKPS